MTSIKPAFVPEEHHEYLLTRLGGESALKGVVYDFYARILEDPKLAPFFDNSPTAMKRLRDHQYQFMALAFTSVPEDVDVAALIAKKHAPLFEKGLNESHFDLVAGHLVATLEHLTVPKNLIEEVVAVVLPLRAVFEANAKKSGEEVLLDRLGGPSALKGAVYEFYGRILEDEMLGPFFAATDMKKMRDHQYKFMELAFSGNVPKDMDVVAYLKEKHQHMIENKGLSGTHFDLVAKHLVETLQHLHVAQPVIDEVVATVGPLRVAFES